MSQFDQSITLPSGVQLKNRLMLSPMTTQLSFFNGVITEDEITYYKQRSKGLGAVITGAANVQDIGKGWPGELSIAHDEMIPRLSELAKAIQGEGAKAIIQIFHGGRMTSRATLSGEQPVSASAVAAKRPDAETPRAMSEEEIVETIQAFGKATRRAIESGFDGIELHGANTYLIQQFFSPHSNRRTDHWGGSVEKRMNFGLAVVQAAHRAIAKYAGDHFMLGYRISPEEIEEPGIRLADTLQFIDELADQPLDYLHVSMGNVWRKSLNDDSEKRPTILRIKKQVHNRLPIIGVGSVETTADAEKVMDEGIDFVALGRESLREPQWVEKVARGHEDAIRYQVDSDALDELGLNPALMDFLGQIGTDLRFIGADREKRSGDSVVFDR